MMLRELRYLVALAERGHFGRAADDCNVTQPTMSTQIRKLEDYLGVTLIERNAKPISVTPIGHDVVRKSRQILSQLDEMLATTTVARGPLTGPLNLGIIPTLAPYLLPSLLPLTKGRFPHLRLVVHEDLTQHLLERLANCQIDAALLALPLDGENLEQLPLFDEPFWFACPPQHPLAQHDAVSEDQLDDEPLLLLADGHCLRGQALAACGRHADSEDPSDDFRAVSLETICQLVAAGFGCTLLPALAARSPLLQKAPFGVKPMKSAAASRRIGLIWRKGYPKASDLLKLADLVRSNPPEGTRTVLIEGSSLGGASLKVLRK